MKNLELNQMEQIDAGGWFGDFCQGFAAASIVYEVGVLTQIWNPVGQSALVGILAINGACLFA